MPIFTLNDNKAQKVAPKDVALERDIQKLFEDNLQEILDIHFLASEYSTSFGGRIDTLGVDMNGAPVIIEYKKSQNDSVINQALSYLRWLLDHKAEFEKLVQFEMYTPSAPPALNYYGNVGEFIDWDSPRVICIAQSFNKFDLDTVAVLPFNIELIKFKLYENDVLSIEFESTKEISTDKVMKTTGTKEKIKVHKEYTIESHFTKASNDTKELYKSLREMIIALDDSIREEPKSKYIAFKLSTNFVDVEVRKDALKLYLNIPKGKLLDEKGISEDVSNKGKWGNGDYVVLLNDKSELDYVFGLISQSYKYNS